MVKRFFASFAILFLVLSNVVSTQINDEWKRDTPLQNDVQLQMDDSGILEQANIIDKAKEIFQAIKDSDLYKTGKEISKWGLPLLKAIGSFAKIITAQFESDSKELKFMKEQFKIINDKMDYVDNQFEEVKRLMDWNVIKIQYSRHEINTDLLQNLINVIAESSPKVRQFAIDNFLRNYDQLYENVAENIYDGFVNQNKVFSENLILAIRKFTKDHRFQIEKFFMGNLQLILKALEVETFYLNLKNFSSVQTFWQEKWNNRLNDLTKLMNSVAEQITENWLQQSNVDIADFNVENMKLSTADYANKLYAFLNNKFRNRMWLVLVYEPLDSGKDHALKVCNGVTQLQLRGHNVAVTSLPLDSKDVDLSRFSRICTDLPTNIGSWGHGPAHYVLLKYLEPKMNCNSNQIGAVIRSKTTKVFLSPPNKAVTCRWSGYYNRFVDIHKTLDIIVMA